MDSFHDAVRKADGIARQTAPITRDQHDWIEAFAADLPWREEQSGAQLPQPERAHAFWAVARYRVAEGRLAEGLAIVRDVGEPDPAVVGHLAATDACRAAGEYRFAVVVPRPTEPHVEGDVLWTPGPVDAPEAVFRLAEQCGHANGSYNLGMLLYERGEIAAAEGAFRRADARGNPRAAGIVAELLRARGDAPGALAAYTRARERGRPMGDAGVVETCERRIAELNAAAGRDGPDETMAR